MRKRVVRLLQKTLGEQRTFEIAVALHGILHFMGLGSFNRLELRTDDSVPLPRLGRLTLIEALLRARALPGCLSDEQLEMLYNTGSGAKRVRWFGAKPEAIQAATMMYAGGALRFEILATSPRTSPDLVIFQNGTNSPAGFTIPAGCRVLRLDGPSVKDIRRRRLHDKIQVGARVKVVVVNDVGFQYGAGVATRRQVQSFLIAGWDVGMLSWNAGTSGAVPVIAKLQAAGRWIGVRSLPSVHPVFRSSNDDIVRSIVDAMIDVDPDFVLFGNIHGANWPTNVLTSLRDEGFPVAAFMHDIHWATGRCAYAGPCRKYIEEGCDETCPTAEQYPPLPRELIRGEWSRRAEVFAGPDPIPLIANSNWTGQVARARFGSAAVVETVHLALDHRQFSRFDKWQARRLLGISDERPLVLLGSVNVKEERKGGPVFLSILEQLERRPDVGVLAFGHGSESLRCTKAFGLVSDERLMALIYSAADVFVGTAQEEAFGQTLLEASAAGLPVIAFKTGGVVEAIEDEVTGLLVDEMNAEAIIAAVDRLLADPDLAERLGQNGIRRVADRFSLRTQAIAWQECLLRLFG